MGNNAVNQAAAIDSLWENPVELEGVYGEFQAFEISTADEAPPPAPPPPLSDAKTAPTLNFAAAMLVFASFARTIPPRGRGAHDSPESLDGPAAPASSREGE